MKYKVLYHNPVDLIEYAKWLNHQFEEHGLDLLAINGFYHIFIESKEKCRETERVLRKAKGE